MKIKHLCLMTLLTAPCAFSAGSSNNRLSGGLSRLDLTKSIKGILGVISGKNGGFPDDFEIPPAELDVAYSHLISEPDEDVDDVDKYPMRSFVLYGDLSEQQWLQFAKKFNSALNESRFKRDTTYLATLYYGGLQMPFDKYHGITNLTRHPIYLEILARINHGVQVSALYNALAFMNRAISAEQSKMIDLLFKYGYTEALRALGQTPLRTYYAYKFPQKRDPIYLAKLCANLFKNPHVSDTEIASTVATFGFGEETTHLVLVIDGIMSNRPALVTSSMRYLRSREDMKKVLSVIGKYLKSNEPDEFHTTLVQDCLRAFRTVEERNAALTSAFHSVYKYLKVDPQELSGFLHYVQQFESETGPINFEDDYSSDTGSESGSQTPSESSK